MNFFAKDKLLYDLEVEPQDIIEQLTPEQVKEIINNLGEHDIDEYEDKFILPTICHNTLNSKAKKKLYYYFNNKKFHCYTECGDNFNIFTLIQRVFAMNGQTCGIQEAVQFVLNNSTFDIDSLNVPYYHSIIEQFRPRIQEATLPVFPNKIMNMFQEFYTQDWKNENISIEAMKYFNIRFSVWRNKIIIPHYDIKGNLVGIRGRALEISEIEAGQKYMPIYIEGKFYAHPLSLNLYGIYENQIGLKKLQRAIVFEGEKSVIKHYDWYREDSCAVAVCGNTINKVQLNLLIKLFDIKELVIGFDKEYHNYPSDESSNYLDRLLKIYDKYKNYVNISIMLDRKNLLDFKDSPVDKGREIFEELFTTRMKLK